MMSGCSFWRTVGVVKAEEPVVEGVLLLEASSEILIVIRHGVLATSGGKRDMLIVIRHGILSASGGDRDMLIVILHGVVATSGGNRDMLIGRQHITALNCIRIVDVLLVVLHELVDSPACKQVPVTATTCNFFSCTIFKYAQETIGTV